MIISIFCPLKLKIQDSRILFGIFDFDAMNDILFIKLRLYEIYCSYQGGVKVICIVFNSLEKIISHY